MEKPRYCTLTARGSAERRSGERGCGGVKLAGTKGLLSFTTLVSGLEASGAGAGVTAAGAAAGSGAGAGAGVGADAGAGGVSAAGTAWPKAVEARGMNPEVKPAMAPTARRRNRIWETDKREVVFIVDGIRVEKERRVRRAPGYRLLVETPGTDGWLRRNGRCRCGRRRRTRRR